MKTMLVSLLGVLTLPGTLLAAETVDYAREVKPLLTKRCIACHGVLKARGGSARYRSEDEGRGGRRPGCSCRHGRRESPDRRRHGHRRAGGCRRRGEPLSAQEITALKAWIDQGAGKARRMRPSRKTRAGTGLFNSQPALRSLHLQGRGNSIDQPDRRVSRRPAERAGVVPGPLADKETLIRRIALDLTGLAPTPNENQSYLEGMVRRRLREGCRPLAGESPLRWSRWGRHWMDVWRYSDWDGYGTEVRESQPRIWRWR